MIKCVNFYSISILSEPMYSRWPIQEDVKAYTGKDFFKVQIRSMSFIVEEYKKFVGIFLDFTF